MIKKLILLSSSMILLYGCDFGNSATQGCTQSPYFTSTNRIICQYPPNLTINNGSFAIGLAFQNGDDSTSGASITMPIAGNQQFRAKATYSDNRDYDVTNLVNWSVVTTTGLTADFDRNNKGLLKITNGQSGTINIHAELQVPNQPVLIKDFTLQIIR